MFTKMYNNNILFINWDSKNGLCNNLLSKLVLLV